MNIPTIPQIIETSEEKERRLQRRDMQIKMFNQRIQDGQVRREAIELQKFKVKLEALQSNLAATSTRPPLVPPEDCLPQHLLPDQPKHILCAKAEMTVVIGVSSKTRSRRKGRGSKHRNGETTIRAR